MEPERQAPIFRAKYQMVNPPQDEKNVENKTRYIVLETPEGLVFEHRDSLKTTSDILDKLGVQYGETFKTEYAPYKIYSQAFVKELLNIAQELSSDFDDASCEASSWSNVVKLETPSTQGSSSHIARRKKLEAFFKSCNIEFTVECFTVHSDMVCKLA